MSVSKQGQVANVERVGISDRLRRDLKLGRKIADHRAGQLALIRLYHAGASDDATPSQDGNSIGNRQRFGELMRYQHDDPALGPQPSQQFEKGSQLAWT